jgi:hypothetical protein
MQIFVYSPGLICYFMDSRGACLIFIGQAEIIPSTPDLGNASGGSVKSQLHGKE